MLRWNRLPLVCLVVTALLVFPRLTPRAIAGDDARAYESAKKKLTALNASENQLSRRDCWLSAIESFSTVYLDYPTGEKADDAAYMVGTLYERLYGRSWVKKDLENATDAFRLLIRDYPDSNLADDALYEIGEITRDRLNDPKHAYCWYRSILTVYPKGDMVPKARARIEELKGYAGGVDCDTVTGAIAGGDRAPAGGGKTKDGPRLLGVRSFNSADHTRVVLDVSRAVDFSEGRVADGAKPDGTSSIYVAIPGGVPGTGVSDAVSLTGGTVAKVSLDVKSDPLRVLLVPNGAVTYKVFSLAGPDRIVIDVYGADGAVDGTSVGDNPPPKTVKSDEIKVVVIDPGHGGKDPGAVGPSGYYEKKANLKIASYLKDYLEKDLGLTVIMTRTSDTFIDLKKRTAIANDKGADLFISIHNNANKSRSPYGISTYYLAITSDKKALTIAARENDTTVEKLSELEYILTDLVVSAKRNESSLLAKFVQEGMVDSVKKGYDNVNSIGVCQGPFWVLVGAQMPSILVECSYISNVREEKRLMSDDYLKGLARGIFNGVKRYIKETGDVRASR